MDYSDVEEGGEDLLEDLFSDGSNNSKSSGDEKNQDDMAEEKKAKKKKLESVEPVPKKVRKHSKYVVLNYDRLNGPNGLRLLKKSFENFKFKGNNHEKEDLIRIIQILKHWMCYQLFPKYSFEETTARLEYLGSKKAVQILMKKMRLGIDSWGQVNPSTMENKEPSECTKGETSGEPEEQNFDTWWQEQLATVNSSDDEYDQHHYNTLDNIAKNDKPYDGVRDDDFNGANNHGHSSNDLNNSCNDGDNVNSTAIKTTETSMIDSEKPTISNDKLKMTNVQKDVSSQPEIILTPEQLERIAKNKKLAEERRLQRLSQKS